MLGATQTIDILRVRANLPRRAGSRRTGGRCQVYVKTSRRVDAIFVDLKVSAGGRIDGQLATGVVRMINVIQRSSKAVEVDIRRGRALRTLVIVIVVKPDCSRNERAASR